MSGNGLSCLEVDECARGLDTCVAQTSSCRNTPGAFRRVGLAHRNELSSLSLVVGIGEHREFISMVSQFPSSRFLVSNMFSCFHPS